MSIGAAVVAVYAHTESGCEVEACSMTVVMKGGVDRSAAVAAQHEYRAVSGLQVGALEHGRVLLTKSEADRSRPRQAVRYSFVVSASNKDPGDVAVGDPDIDFVLEAK